MIRKLELKDKENWKNMIMMSGLQKNDRLKQKTLFEITALAVEKSYTSVLDIRSNHCCCWH